MCSCSYQTSFLLLRLSAFASTYLTLFAVRPLPPGWLLVLVMLLNPLDPAGAGFGIAGVTPKPLNPKPLNPKPYLYIYIYI